MSNTDTNRLIVSREFAAPRELVWEAWTDPAHVKKWHSQADAMKIGSVIMDLREGGRFRIQMQADDGEYYTAAGTYLEVKAPEKLVYTWDWEKDGGGEEFGELEGNETQVTIELHAVGDRTKFVLTHERFATTQSRDNHEKGWTIWLERVANYLETKN